MFGLVQAAFGGHGRACSLRRSQLRGVANHGHLSTFTDTQTHPRQLAVTVDTVILATQQEKESLLFQL